MFSFKRDDFDEAAPRPWQGLMEHESMEDSDDADNDNDVQMEDPTDDNSDNKMASDLVVFPESTSMRILQVTPDNKILIRDEFCIDTLVQRNPQVLAALESCTELNISQKSVIATQPAMPMPVHASPALTLLMGKNQSKPRYISWMTSVYQLRQVLLEVRAGSIPFHKSVTPEQIDNAYDDFVAQMALRYDQQIQWISESFVRAAQNIEETESILLEFIKQLQAYSIFYINSLELYVWKLLIEPHGHPMLTLSDVLTPLSDLPMLSQCFNPYQTRDQIVDFFVTKHVIMETYMKQHVDTYTPLLVSVDLKQLPHRISVSVRNNDITYYCPAGTVYREYITLQTIYEYWRSFDDGHVLNEYWNWNPSMWKLQ